MSRLMFRMVWWNLLGLWLSLTWTAPSFAAEELQQLLDRLLAVPTIQTEAGFTATVLIPPGSLYDPFDLHASGATLDTTLWISDDGKEEDDNGGRILTVDASGTVSVVADVDALLPPVALDMAPPSFGTLSGQIFTVAFARPDAEAGFLVPNVIQRIDPATGGVENDVHVEGGGGNGVIVYFSMRGSSDHIYDLLDSDLNLKRAITIHDFAKDLAYWSR